ncbi:MAG: hypothetical protein LDL24_00055 [Treponema sp.]|nr:hypothetical protein [Treponema sp.]
MTRTLKVFALYTLILCVSITPLVNAAAYSAEDRPYSRISDDAALRRSLIESYFILPVSQLLKKQSARFTLDTGELVEVRIEKGSSDVLIVLARERQGLYPGWVQGSWILYRNLNDGSPKKIRLYLRSDPYVYVEFRPAGANKSVFDVVAYSGYVLYSRPVPLDFQDLYSSSVNQVLTALGHVFPREYFDVDPRMYGDLRFFISRLKASVPALSYADDGALDEQGRPVYIASLMNQKQPWGLNCSGFAKWVVDGLLRPMTGTSLPIEPLKTPIGNRGSSFTEPVESKLDPFFGLDWTRNLALAANRILRSPSYASLDEIDVADVPVSQLIIKKDNKSQIISFPAYMKNAGFNIEGLPSIMYSLAVRYPSWFYLVSVNTDKAAVLRQYPTNAPLSFSGGAGIRRHFHVAVLIPYFTEDGVFKVSVFESAAETSFDAFVRRYPGYQVHLVRIPFQGTFGPPEAVY